MKQPRVAARYAKSLMLMAKEKTAVDKVYADMQMIHNLLIESKDLALMLKSPIINDDKKSEILKSIFDGKVETLTFDFIQLTVAQSRASVLGEIAEAYVNLFKAEKGIATVHVTTAEVLKADMKSKLIEKIKNDNQLNQVEVVEHVDASIIGGMILRMDDMQLDESIKAQVNKIEREFLKA